MRSNFILEINDFLNKFMKEEISKHIKKWPRYVSLLLLVVLIMVGYRMQKFQRKIFIFSLFILRYWLTV